jgi:hypothetical protein
MQRLTVHIQIDAASRAYAAKQAGTWERAFAPVADDLIHSFASFAPEALLLERNNHRGFIRFMLPVEYQLEALPNLYSALLGTLAGNHLEFEHDYLDGPRPESMVEASIERYAEEEIHTTLDEDLFKVPFVYTKDFAARTGYYFHPKTGLVHACAMVYSPIMGGMIWHDICQYDRLIDIQDLLLGI